MQIKSPKTKEEINDIYVQTLTITATSFAHKHDTISIKPEIIDFDKCLKKYKNLKNLKKQLEKSQKDNDDIIDMLHCNMSILQLAYNHSDFLITREIQENN